MKKTISLKIVFFYSLLISAALWADSPITSTTFYEAYRELEIVREANNSGVVDLEIAGYLYSKSIPIDLKAAVINALSWSTSGKRNSDLFSYYLSLQYGITRDELSLDIMEADELFCLGYLMVMDNYFRPSGAVPFLERASSQMGKSFTVAVILAIVKAQEKTMAQNFNGIWDLIEAVLQDPWLEHDMRREAEEIIVDYMSLYR